MHGRVKVKTTAQQQEEKRKEREKKLRAYTAAIKLIFKKREEQTCDEEGLKVAEEILRSNPDFSTLWNFRREIFLSYQEERPKEELQDLFTYELGFLEGCLQVNPKSYGVWHHREWVLNHMPTPNWKREVDLCNLFLQYDERNYSVNPDRPTEEILLQEYELAQNAFFTDPNDQSAWFYHRWLLGRGKKQQSLRMLNVNKKQRRLFVTFSQAVNIAKDGGIIVYLNDKAVEGTWHTPSGENIYSLLWIFELSGVQVLDGPVSFKVEFELPGNGTTQLTANCSDGIDKLTVESDSEKDKAHAWFTSQLSSEKTDVLEKELESCKQLQELEEDNKWCILTVIFLMRALDPLKHAAETMTNFDALIAADPCRRHYFEDLRSKFVIENVILERQEKTYEALDLSGKNLSSLYHTDHMAAFQEVNLRSNHLKNINGCKMLQALSKLNADDNEIDDISELAFLPCLEDLSLCRNNISSLKQLHPLSRLQCLKKLDLHGNSVCNIENFTQEIHQLIPSLKELNGQPL
ncbi:Geranylgeranyl transferase type-2 subunit alpha [Holothuria leucospilota]|uniref:Geranylgeranyl transferase type-2 subunit alpha n=1 Tax=Holothuria leucospilota TaxID=206669 RepID=A0A9Q1C9P5_HOLLE|nr:Geranylgeranyl transferase type-2 subunit alpha [Holothuria leucospilota]